MRLALCALLALAGCASEHKAPPAPPSAPASAPAVRAIERVPVRTLASLPAAAPRGIALEVRGPQAADLASIEAMRAETRRMTGQSLALSGVGAAEALLIPGFFSGSLVAGALILAPLAVGLNSAERRQHETIVAALQQADLVDGTRAALVARLPAPSPEPGATLAVIVLAYGLVPKYGKAQGPLCLSVVADLVLHAGHREIYRDTVHMAPYRRSADAPPPVCAAMEDFAAKDGAPVRNAALDAAQVLAAIARHRLAALPWTS